MPPQTTPETLQTSRTQAAAAAPAAFQPMPSTEPIPVPEAASPAPDVQLTAYARPTPQAAPQRPPVPPVTRYTPVAEPPAAPPASLAPTSAALPATTEPEMTRAERRLRGLPPLPHHRYQSPDSIQPAAAQAPAMTPSSAAPLTPPAPIVPPPAVDRLPALLSAAQYALANGQYDLAEQHLDRARSYAPQDARPEALRARLYEMRGEWTKAVETFDRLIILEPKMTTWRSARARAFFKLGEYAKAIGDFRTVEATGARLSLNDYTLLCEAAFRQGDAANVRYALDRIAQINPEPHPRSELIRGLIAFRTGQSVEARNILLRASARWPRNDALTEALRRTSAVYYRNKHSQPVAATGAFDPPMSAVESASLELVKEFTPPVPNPPAVIWTRSPDESRSTTQAAPPGEPARLGAVFAEAILPIDDGWRTMKPTPPPSGIIPAGHTTARETPIGFR